MAVTTTRLFEQDNDGIRTVLATVLLDSSYPTGGEAVVLGDLGLTRVTQAIVGAAVNATPTAFVGVWDQTNSKLLAFQQSAATSGLTQVPNATDLSALTFVVLFFGV
jgi:hypothetical protein